MPGAMRHAVDPLRATPMTRNAPTMTSASALLRIGCDGAEGVAEDLAENADLCRQLDAPGVLVGGCADGGGGVDGRAVRGPQDIVPHARHGHRGRTRVIPRAGPAVATTRLRVG